MTARKFLEDGTLNPRWKPNASGKSGKSGAMLSTFGKARFCAWDGEGADIDGRHEYILLANSDGDELVNLKGIPTSDALGFIVSRTMAMDRRTIHVWFVMSYDVNMILRDVPKKDISTLWHGGSIDFGIYNIEYRHRKELTIRVFNPNNKWHQIKGKWQRKWTYSVRMWDVFGYFQHSFVETIREWYGNEFSKEELDSIEENKRKRAVFRPEDIDSIKAYCNKELSALLLLCGRLQSYLSQANLIVSRWDGAGSVAAALLRREGIRNHLPKPDPSIENLWRYGYAGGRIELIQYGYHDKGIYTYDINSAYPSAMLELPSMTDGHWEKVTAFVPGSFGIWYVEYNNDSRRDFPFHPLFYRSKSGNIFYPFRTRGYFWTPEVANAVKYFPYDTLIHHGYIWHPETDTKPFAFIQDLYTLRKQWKKEGIGAQIVLKLGLNSLYGKMAQQVGGHNGRKPPYHNLAWAGFVTSATRARLYGAAISSPDSIIFMATDGLASTRPLDSYLNIGTEIGQWEKGFQQSLLAVQSGVYFYWRKDEDTPKAYYRGFDKGQLSPDKIMRAYRLGEKRLNATSTRFIGMGTALVGARWQQWRSWPTISRELSLSPLGTKRYDHWESERWLSRDNPSLRLFRTIASPLNEGVSGGMSHPYPIRWMGEDWEEGTIDGIRITDYENEYDDSSL